MSRSFQADMVILLVTVLAASGWIFTKLALTGLPPVAFLSLRFGGAFLLLALFCHRRLFSLTRKQWKYSLLVGLTQSAAMTIWIFAINNASRVSEGAFITSMLAIIAPFIGRLLFGHKIKPETLMALPVAVAGLALLGLDGDWQFEQAQILFFISAFGFALHINLTNHLGQGIPSMPFTAIQMATVGLSTFIASAFFETWPAEVSSDAWFWLAASILIATGFRYTLQTWGIKNSTPGNAALFMILEPLWTAMMSVIWLSESMDARSMLGCFLILCALFVSRWRLLLKLKKTHRLGTTITE